MPVQLSLSQINQAIFREAGGKRAESESQSSARLLSRIFHESFIRLFANDHKLNWRSVIENAEPKLEEWQRLLQEHTYKRLIGPRLGREQAYLHHSTEQVVAFWQAARFMCHWIADLLWRGRRAAKHRTDPQINLLMSSEEPLTHSFCEEGWTDSVTLTGIADLVLRIPGKPHWCIVKLTLGQPCPEADLAQVCLYHQILSSLDPSIAETLALIEFKPHRQERLFDAVEIKDAQKQLLNVIGQMAGVLPGKKRSEVDQETSVLQRADLEKHHEHSEQLILILKEYDKEMSLDGLPVLGPAFFRYPIKPGKNVRLGDLQKVAQKVQRRLHLSAQPYIHLSEGGMVIDIQRSDRKYVYFSEIRHQLPKLDPIVGCSLVPLGIDLNGRLKFADLSDPLNVHILAAGSAGSGKNEWLRAVLAGLILTNSPETLRLVLIDLRRNVFNELKESSFLLSRKALVYPDEQSAAQVLKNLADEMDERYRIFHHAAVDTRDQFARTFRKGMPRIVCMCDEYFDLINREKSERKSLEAQILRLGAKARAAGIHLVIATQQPCRQTIKGVLDAIIPARVGLKMSRAIESNMLLNQKGAEALLGQGDLLFKDIGDPIRLQAPYLLPEERITFFRR